MIAPLNNNKRIVKKIKYTKIIKWFIKFVYERIIDKEKKYKIVSL